MYRATIYQNTIASLLQLYHATLVPQKRVSKIRYWWEGPHKLTGHDNWQLTAQQCTDMCTVQLSHRMRQSNAGRELRDKDESLAIMAEHLGGAALEQYETAIATVAEEPLVRNGSPIHFVFVWGSIYHLNGGGVFGAGHRGRHALNGVAILDQADLVVRYFSLVLYYSML